MDGTIRTTRRTRRIRRPAAEEGAAGPSRGRDPVALMRRVGRALVRLEREQICCGTVTRHQFATLHALEEAGGLSTSELAARLGIDLSTASRNLAVLERAGCVRRRAALHDGRLVRNVVTAKGRGCIDALCCDERAVLQAVLDRLPSGERPGVVRALARLAEALDQATACCDAGAACTPPAARRSRPRGARAAAGRRASRPPRPDPTAPEKHR
jgi:DNA-binding MarR family transcriptional regulator